MSDPARQGFIDRIRHPQVPMHQPARPQLTDLTVLATIEHCDELYDVLEIEPWTRSADSGVRSIIAVDEHGQRITLTAYQLNSRGWTLVRPAPMIPDVPPTPVSHPRAVLAEIERVMARQDRARRELDRQGHFTLCVRGCARCEPHR